MLTFQRCRLPRTCTRPPYCTARRPCVIPTQQLRSQHVLVQATPRSWEDWWKFVDEHPELQDTITAEDEEAFLRGEWPPEDTSSGLSASDQPAAPTTAPETPSSNEQPAASVAPPASTPTDTASATAAAATSGTAATPGSDSPKPIDTAAMYAALLRKEKEEKKKKYLEGWRPPPSSTQPPAAGSRVSYKPKAPVKAAVNAAVPAVPAAPTMPYVPSGAPETAWYCWPEGFIGQSFTLAGKLEPRASPLLEDVDRLSDFTVRGREQCSYSEHTIDSAESASQMIQAVVGGAVDMGLFNASGSASLDMSREFSSRAVSHTLVASFQENELLQMVRPSLTDAAKDVLAKEGPAAFAARYGTHFVSGVGHRGAFIGSITVKLSEMTLAAGASVSFQAAYKGVSTMAELKASMKQNLKTSDVTFRWHKWGVEDDESLDQLEQYCGTDDARFAGMRALAMHTADQASGYPKLIKLRPYSTLPDYVEACSKYCSDKGQRPLEDLLFVEQALSYLTKQYRKASYISQVIQNDIHITAIKNLNTAYSSLQSQTSIMSRINCLMKVMEELFKSKPQEQPTVVGPPYEYPPGPPTMLQLQAFFKYYPDPFAYAGDDPESQLQAQAAFRWGSQLKAQLDEVDHLDFHLFKAVQRPMVHGPQSPNLQKPDVNNTRALAHIAAVSNASTEAPFGRWYLDYQEQETFTKPGLYVVRLASGGSSRLQQVGRTQRLDFRSGKPGYVLNGLYQYIGHALNYKHGTIGDKPEDNVFVALMVGVNPIIKDIPGENDQDEVKTSLRARQELKSLTGINFTSVRSGANDPNMSFNQALGSWAAVSFAARTPDSPAKLVRMATNIRSPGIDRRTGTEANAPSQSAPAGMVMVEQVLPLYNE